MTGIAARCAPAANGHAAALTVRPINSRRLMHTPKAQDTPIVPAQEGVAIGPAVNQARRSNRGAGRAAPAREISLPHLVAFGDRGGRPRGCDGAFGKHKT